MASNFATKNSALYVTYIIYDYWTRAYLPPNRLNPSGWPKILLKLLNSREWMAVCNCSPLLWNFQAVPMGWCARGQKQVDFVATLMKDQMAPPFPVQCFPLLFGLVKKGWLFWQNWKQSDYCFCLYFAFVGMIVSHKHYFIAASCFLWCGASSAFLLNLGALVPKGGWK